MTRNGVPERVRPRRPAAGSGMGWLCLLAVAKLMLHLATAGGYGYFRDELYYLDAARHLAWGYVDFPPLVAVLAAGIRSVLGVSPEALRFLPALAGALLVLLTGLIGRELGAQAFGQTLAALACLLSPLFLVSQSFFSMNPFDQLWWALLAYLLIRLLRHAEPRLWLLCGLVIGLGLLTKESFLAWIMALAAGILVTPARTHPRSRWSLVGSLALVMVAPYLFWQFTHGWPTLEFLRGYQAHLLPHSALDFVAQQFISMNPATLPLTVAGLYFYLGSADGRPYRALGWAFLLLYLLFMLAHAKAYFLAPAYPVLFAGGARAIESLLARGFWRLVRPAYAGALLATGLFLIPLTLPLLPPATLARAYAPAMANPAIHVESDQEGVLPEWLAGRLGWQEMAAAVGRVYASLPPDEQRAACILAGNYGEAGALNFYKSVYGLPQVVSGHNNYYLWGTGDCTGDVMIAIGVNRAQLHQFFGAVAEEARLVCDNCMPGENDVPVYVVRQPRLPLRQAWPAFKRFGM